MPLASELTCLAITPGVAINTLCLLTALKEVTKPHFVGNIKDFIRKSRTPTLKNEPPLPNLSPPCFKSSPLPHLSLRWTGLTCGTRSHYSVIMEDKTCAKKFFKKSFQCGNESDKDSVLVWKNHCFRFSVWWHKTPSVPLIAVSFWYCRLPCFNVLFLSFFGEPSVPETDEICGSSQCQNVYNNKFTKFGAFKGSNLLANSTYSRILAEANVGYFIPLLMTNINCNVNNGS